MRRKMVFVSPLLLLLLNSSPSDGYSFVLNKGPRTTSIAGMTWPLFNVSLGQGEVISTDAQRREVFSAWQEATSVHLEELGLDSVDDYREALFCYPGPAIYPAAVDSLPPIATCDDFISVYNKTTTEVHEFVALANNSTALSEMPGNLSDVLEDQLSRLSRLQSYFPVENDEIATLASQVKAIRNQASSTPSPLPSPPPATALNSSTLAALFNETIEQLLSNATVASSLKAALGLPADATLQQVQAAAQKELAVGGGNLSSLFSVVNSTNGGTITVVPVMGAWAALVEDGDLLQPTLNSSELSGMLSTIAVNGTVPRSILETATKDILGATPNQTQMDQATALLKSLLATNQTAEDFNLTIVKSEATSLFGTAGLALNETTLTAITSTLRNSTWLVAARQESGHGDLVTQLILACGGNATMRANLTSFFSALSNLTDGASIQSVFDAYFGRGACTNRTGFFDRFRQLVSNGTMLSEIREEFKAGNITNAMDLIRAQMSGGANGAVFNMGVFQAIDNFQNGVRSGGQQIGSDIAQFLNRSAGIATSGFSNVVSGFSGLFSAFGK